MANYFGGSVAVLPILADGRLGDATDIKIDYGKIGPAKATNAPPGSFAFSGHDRTHAHMIQADPSGRFVLHVDLGLDQIFVWKFDEQQGLLTPNEPHAVSLPPGDGPRHFHFHPNGRWLYSIQEEASTIVLFDYDGAAGRLAPRQSVSSLPPGFAGSNFCSEILVSADGRFVYAGNRLHDSIGIFSVGRNGELTFIGEEWTRGNYPRSFNFDPTGHSSTLAINVATTSRRSTSIEKPAASNLPAVTRPSEIPRASFSWTSQSRLKRSQLGDRSTMVGSLDVIE